MSSGFSEVEGLRLSAGVHAEMSLVGNAGIAMGCIC
jgi:hypothetical protein